LGEALRHNYRHKIEVHRKTDDDVEKREKLGETEIPIKNLEKLRPP